MRRQHGVVESPDLAADLGDRHGRILLQESQNFSVDLIEHGGSAPGQCCGDRRDLEHFSIRQRGWCVEERHYCVFKAKNTLGGVRLIEQAREALKRVYGYDSFRKGQEDIISGIIAGARYTGNIANRRREIDMLSNSIDAAAGYVACYIAAHITNEGSGGCAAAGRRVGGVSEQLVRSCGISRCHAECDAGRI